MRVGLWGGSLGLAAALRLTCDIEMSSPFGDPLEPFFIDLEPDYFDIMHPLKLDCLYQVLTMCPIEFLEEFHAAIKLLNVILFKHWIEQKEYGCVELVVRSGPIKQGAMPFTHH